MTKQLKLHVEKHPHIATAAEQAKPASFSVDFKDENDKIIYGFHAADADYARSMLGTILFALKATQHGFTSIEDHIDIVEGAITQIKLLGE